MQGDGCGRVDGSHCPCCHAAASNSASKFGRAACPPYCSQHPQRSQQVEILHDPLSRPAAGRRAAVLAPHSAHSSLPSIGSHVSGPTCVTDHCPYNKHARHSIGLCVCVNGQECVLTQASLSIVSTNWPIRPGDHFLGWSRPPNVVVHRPASGPAWPAPPTEMPVSQLFQECVSRSFDDGSSANSWEIAATTETSSCVLLNRQQAVQQASRRKGQLRGRIPTLLHAAAKFIPIVGAI